ncbi:MAG: SIMPL domain-containing protein [Minisyncoccia bacterium]
MNQTTKNILGGAIVLAVLAIGYAALSFVNSYGESIQPSSFRSFSVSGQGKAIAIPDVAEFTFTVITQGGKDITSLQSQNTTATNKAIAFVKSEGVADKDIQTQYYDVSPDYQTYNCNVIPQIYNGASSGSSGSVISTPPVVQPCPPASIVGYTITQSVDVKIRDFTKIGDIVGGVVTNGANQVGQLSFTLDDPSTVQNQAEADAIVKAKVEAQAIAQAGGFRIGRLLNVQTGGVPYPIYAENASMGAMAVPSAKSIPTPTIQPGSEEVDMTVTLQYEIQ